MAYVYILYSTKDNKRYIGSTPDLKRRLDQHNNGYVLSTKNRRPFILRGYQFVDTLTEARALENKYKRSSGFLSRAIKSGTITIVTDGV